MGTYHARETFQQRVEMSVGAELDWIGGTLATGSNSSGLLVGLLSQAWNSSIVISPATSFVFGQLGQHSTVDTEKKN
jgi:hypothetical protein